MPNVTICIPAYNVAPFIEQTLDTLLRQTYQDFVVVVSDNHSTDDTVDIIRRYRHRDPRIGLTTCPILREDTSLRTSALSAVDNSKHLLSSVKTEFVALYHADDLYHQTILAEELAFLNRHQDASLVFTMGKNLNCHGNRVSRRSTSLPRSLKGIELFQYHELLSALVKDNMQIMTPTCLMRRKAIIEGGLPRKKYEHASDYDYWLRLAKIGPVGVIDRPLFLHRVGKHQDSVAGQTLYRYKHFPIVRLLETHVKALPESNDVKQRLLLAMRRTKLNQHLRIANNLVLDGNIPEAIRIYSNIIRDGGVCSMNGREQVYANLLKSGIHLGVGRFLVKIYLHLSTITRSIRWRMRPFKPADL